MKKSIDQTGFRCPIGLLIGVDWGSCMECEDDCPSDIFYYCKDIKCSCTGKADFGSKIIADQAARKYTNSYFEYNSYECKYCGGWHIGSVW